MKKPPVFPWHQLVADIYENVEPSEGIKQEAKLLLRQSEGKYKLDDVIAELRLRAQLLLAEALARDVIEGLIVILDSSGLPIKIKVGHAIPTGAACPMITVNAGNSWLASKGIPLTWNPTLQVRNQSLPPVKKEELIRLMEPHCPSIRKKLNEAASNGLNEARISRGVYDPLLALQIARSKGWTADSPDLDLVALFNQSVRNAKFTP